MTAADLTNDSGPALQLSAMRVVEDLIASDSETGQILTARGSGKWGVIQLAHARIGGRLVLTGAQIEHTAPVSTEDGVAGPGLNAPSLVTGANMLLDKCHITGSGPQGAVRLAGAHIGGMLSLAGTSVESVSGPALSAPRITTDRGLRLDGATLTSPPGIPAEGDIKGTESEEKGADGVAKGTVRFIGATIRGNLVLDLDLINAAIDPERRQLWAVEDLTYTNTPTGPAGLPLHSRHWLGLLRKGTTGYRAQPYQHLAAATRAAGHDEETRTVLITQREHQIAAGGLTRGSRAWARFTGLTLKYGYQPWRALIWASGATFLAILLALTLGGQGGLAHTTAGGGGPCGAAERISYALDGFLPLVRTGARDTCRPVLDTWPGTIIQFGGWTLGLITWAFITLFIAGFTNIIRKT
uniref:hypothetical protein n=1 Tax=Arsenicicoccus bolidensis TaxID=229480 RepID=UPI0004925B44|nr:hypothetical protein [Arsenicicoccus bolidensis]